MRKRACDHTFGSLPCPHSHNYTRDLACIHKTQLQARAPNTLPPTLFIIDVTHNRDVHLSAAPLLHLPSISDATSRGSCSRASHHAASRSARPLISHAVIAQITHSARSPLPAAATLETCSSAAGLLLSRGTIESRRLQQLPPVLQRKRKKKKKKKEKTKRMARCSPSVTLLHHTTPQGL